MPRKVIEEHLREIKSSLDNGIEVKISTKDKDGFWNEDLFSYEYGYYILVNTNNYGVKEGQYNYNRVSHKNWNRFKIRVQNIIQDFGLYDFMEIRDIKEKE